MTLDVYRGRKTTKQQQQLRSHSIDVECDLNWSGPRKSLLTVDSQSSWLLAYHAKMYLFLAHHCKSKGELMKYMHSQCYSKHVACFGGEKLCLIPQSLDKRKYLVIITDNFC